MDDDLHWLIIPQRLQYKLAVTAHRCLRQEAPRCRMSVSKVAGRQHLRSARCRRLNNSGTSVAECYKDDVESQWKSLKFDPRHLKTPEPMVTIICMRDYFPDT